MKLRKIFLFAIILSLTACSGDEGVGGTGLSDEGIGGTGASDEGIGGTGIGTVTGFSSIIIDDNRIFDIGPDTVLRIDGRVVTEQAFRLSGLGFVASYQIAKDVNSNLTAGTLLTLDANNYLRGPITSLEPLKIFDQEAVTTAKTVGGDGAQLSIGNFVEVSGFADANNVLRATRLNNLTAGEEWKLTGIAINLVAGGFSIGSQPVQLNGVIPRDCNGGLQAGDLVEVTAVSDNLFTPGGVINTVKEVECKNSGLELPDDVDEPVEAEIKGILTQVFSSSEFLVNGQRIRVNSSTVFEGGNSAGMISGVLIEVEGIYDPTSGILDAEKIEFEEQEGEEDDKEDEENGEESEGDDNESESEDESEEQ